jgi:flagellar hook-basal body complex protein FliE
MMIDSSFNGLVGKISNQDSALGKVATPGGLEQVDFSDVLNSAMDKINATDSQSVVAGEKLAVNQLENPHDLTIASTEAELTLNYAIEVKNRIIDSYKEIMRLQL